MRKWVSWGNGIRTTFCDACEDIPDIDATKYVTGDDGKIYKNGIFDRQLGDNPDFPSHIFVIDVEQYSTMH